MKFLQQSLRKKSEKFEMSGVLMLVLTAELKMN